jgi:hypothetical protein
MHRISPPLRQRRLGFLLRELRLQRGMTQKDAALALGWSASKLGRAESGECLITPGAVEDALDLYQPEEAVRRECRRLIMDAHRRPWWEPYRRVLGEVVALETEAVLIRSWQPLLVPGLLQTEAYARAVFEAGRVGEDQDMIDLRVKARMARQRVFAWEMPPRLEAVVGERALRQRMSDPVVMKEQLVKVLEMMRLPNVGVWVLPDDAPAHAGLDGSFVLLDLPGGASSVFIEGAPGEFITDQETFVYEYSVRYAVLKEAALTAEASAELIIAIHREI